MKIVTLRKDLATSCVYLEWTGYPSGTMKFKVYMSTTDAGNNWQELGETPNPFFADMFSMSKDILLSEFIYKIEAYALNGAAPIDTLITAGRPVPNILLARTLNVLHYAANQVFKNPNWAWGAHLLKARNTGQRCQCASIDFNASTRPTCTICYGTGYVGGFFDPIRIRLKLNEEVLKQKDINESTPTGVDLATWVAPSIPEANPKDYLVVDNTGIFIVMDTTVRAAAAHRSPTMLLRTSLLQPADIVYRYPLQSKVPVITAIKQDADFNYVIEGRNLIPVFGTVQLTVTSEANNLQFGVYYAKDILTLTDTRIVIKSNLQGLTGPFTYIAFLNNDIVTGRCENSSPI